MDIRSSTDGAQIPGISPTSTGPKLRISALKPNEIEALRKVFQGTFKLNISETKLDNRRAEVAPGPQESVPAEAPAPAEQKSAFSKLIDEINQGEYKVGFFAKLRIWLNNLRTSNYDIEVAKKAFSQIHNKKEFLQAALEFIALRDNAEKMDENMQLLLKFCQSAHGDTKLFVKVLTEENPIQLAELLVGDKLKINDWFPYQCNELAVALAGAGTDGIAFLKELLGGKDYLGEFLKEFPEEKDNKLKINDWYPYQCNALAVALAGAGTDGVAYLEELLKEDKLKINDWFPYQCNELAIALTKNENGGVAYLEELLKEDKLKINNWFPYQCNELAIALTKVEEGGVKLLEKLFEGLRTDGWSPYQCNEFAIALTKVEEGGVKLLEKLLKEKDNKLKTNEWSTWQCNEFAIALTKVENGGIKLLKKLLEENDNKLKTNEWSTWQCNQLAIVLTKVEDGGVELLKRLLEEKDNKLKTNEWSTYQCNQLAMELAGNENGGVELLKKLLGEDKLPQFQLWGYSDCTASKTRALELLNSGENGIAELKSLIGYR